MNAGRKEFQERMKERPVKEEGEEEEEERRGMNDRIKKELEGMMEAKRGWWDEECRESKKRVRWELRRWRRERGGGERYRKERERHNDMCTGKKRKETERWERR